jgi:PAS domain S-box-containing protein
MNVSLSQPRFRPNPQALALLVLAINGTIALFHQQVLWWQLGSIGIILLLGICHLFNRPFTILPITLEFFLVLGLTIALMLSTGGTSSFFLAWLFILALYYPLQLPTALAVWTPLLIGVVYFSLVLLSPPGVPLGIVFARSLLLATVGWSIYDLAWRLEQANVQQKKSLDDLEQKQNYIRNLVETIPGITYVGARDGTFFMSPQVETLLGYSPQEFIENKTFWHTCLHPDDLEAVMHQMHRKYAPGEMFACEYRMVAKDGRILWFRDEAKVERDTDGYIRELQGVMLEITQRKEDERQLSYQASLVNNMVDAVVSTDKGYRILTMNQAAERLYGYTQTEAVGKTVGELLQNEYPNSTRERVIHDLLSQGFWLGEVTQLNKVGERFPVLVSVSKVFDKAGNFIGTVAINKDMREMKQAQLALQHMARRYRQLLEQAAEGILVTDQTLQLILVNQALCEMLGFSEQELLQMKIPDLIHPENLAHLPLQTDAIRSGKIVKSERLLKRKDGSSLLVLGSAKMLPDGTIQTILHDITERKQAEEKLQQTEAFYRAVTEKSYEGITVIDKAGKVRYRSTANVVFSGYENDQVTEENFAMFTHPDDQKRVTETIQHLSPNESRLVEFRFKPAHSEWRWLEARITNLLDYPAVNGYVINARDISERKQAEENLQQAEAFYRAVTEQSNEGVMVFDKNMIIQYRNPSQLHMSSFPYEEMVGQDRTDTIHPDDLKEFLLELPQLQPGQTLLNTFRMQNKQGSWDWFESHVTNLLEHPPIEGYVANYYNINERKAAEARQRELSQRLLNVQEDERRSLARELHDEIGQSLTAVKVGLQTAQRLETLEPIANAMSITDQLLSQVRELSLNLHPGLLEDLGLVAAVRWYTLQQAERSGLTIDFTLCLEEAHISPELKITIYRIVQEGLTNIIRHSQARQVCISLTELHNEVCLSIKDDGVGFDVTRQSKASLGLLGMKERVSLQGGHFQLESAPETGTAIYATFPLGD